LRTKARVRFKKQERIQRQAAERIITTLSGDQRRIIGLSAQGYEPGEIARELALDSEYVYNFMTGLIQRLTHECVIASPEWRNVLAWASSEDLMDS
jgi:DNA-binding CsgD family transcriptional regulator